MPRMIAVVVEKRGCRKHCGVVIEAIEYESLFNSFAFPHYSGSAVLGSTRATRLPKRGSIINMKRFLFGDDHRPA